MSEQYLSDSELAALSGTSDAEQDVLYIATGESPYYLSFYKMLHRLLEVARRAGDLRVFKDGDLSFGVRAGKFMNGDTAVAYAGSLANALTDNATNYIYLTAAGVLTKNTSGFPNPSLTPHLPLATILTAAGAYAHSDITDYRGRCFLRVLTGLSAAAMQDLLPNLNVTAGAEVAHVRAVTVQLRDGGNNALAARGRFRLWIAATEYAAPSATDNTVAITTGAQLRELTANADYEVISDAAGTVVFNLTVAGTVTRYVMAELDGRIYSSGALSFD